ncbi:MAG TPA: hydroxymethylbilane synthase [Chloroflexota bacterium]
MRILRVGTRKSALATRQSEMVVAALRRARPEARFELVQISTEGDERRDASLREIGGSGVFVKRIERALLANEVDLAVHSLKDVPTELEPGLMLAAIPARADPRDALVVRLEPRPEPASPACAIEEIARERLPDLPHGARVGTGSARRAAQLRAIREDLEILDVRGNVDTRLRKLDAGELDALVLAAAGLARLGRLDRATRLLDPKEMVPMVGQGALAIEVRSDDQVALETAAALDDWPTRVCVEAERAFLAALGGGCALPVGALAVLEDGEKPAIRLRVALADERGRRVERLEVRAAVDQIGQAAVRLAAEALRAVEG